MSVLDKRTHTTVRDEEHHSSASYWLVWIALLVLTVVTYVTGRMHMPTWGIFIAMAIAITKATLVVMFFMHLWEQKGINRVVMVVSVITVAMMFLGTFSDVYTRLPSLLPRTAPMTVRGINANIAAPGAVPAGTVHAPEGAEGQQQEQPQH